jgi:hypothetical protein
VEQTTKWIQSREGQGSESTTAERPYIFKYLTGLDKESGREISRLGSPPPLPSPAPSLPCPLPPLPLASPAPCLPCPLPPLGPLPRSSFCSAPLVLNLEQVVLPTS